MALAVVALMAFIAYHFNLRISRFYYIFCQQAMLPLAASLLAFVEDVRTFVHEQTPEVLSMVIGIKKIARESADLKHTA